MRRGWSIMLASLFALSAHAAPPEPKTPIRHLVVIYDENISFDHYFATYPHAANPPGEPAFTAAPGTPHANTLEAAGLLTNNPNFTNTANGKDAANPFRLSRSQAHTADMDHDYEAEQRAYDHGKADLFPRYTGREGSGGGGAFDTKGLVMGYFDGNTVTALWRWASRFAMSDNAYGDTYGPSTLGALNLVSGQTNGVTIVDRNRMADMAMGRFFLDDGAGGVTLMADADPGNDVCAHGRTTVSMQGRNIGDLLNKAGVTWGGFMGGFDLTVTNPNGTSGCKRSTHSDIVGADIKDYVAHHAWFQYYPSTANPQHKRPASVAAIGHAGDPANHQYDLHDFFDAVRAGNFPSVSILKQVAVRDGHAGYSDPLDEQAGLVEIVNFLQARPEWTDTAIIIAWDDSDGWYDHAAVPPTNPSFDAKVDQLDGPGQCGTGTPLPGIAGKPVNGRCGPGPRLPFLVISPWAKANHISHDRISQVSITRFIEDNWLSGERLGGGSFDETAGPINDLFDFAGKGGNPPLWLDPATGDILTKAP
jgi:phospholipase C